MLALSLNPPMGVSERGDVGVFGVIGSGGGAFVRVREVLAGFGRFVGVFGRVWSAWGRAAVGDVLLILFAGGCRVSRVLGMPAGWCDAPAGLVR